MRSFAGKLTFYVLLGLVQALTPVWALSRTFDSGAITRNFLYEPHAVDGNANTNLHQVPGNFQVTFSTTQTFESHAAQYRLAVQLLDAAGTPVQIDNGSPQLVANTAFTAPQQVSLSSIALFPNTPVTTQRLTFQTLFDPEVVLATAAPYRLRVRLQRAGAGALIPIYTDTGEVFETNARELFHFTNQGSPDAQLNVLAKIEEVSWEKTAALATQTSQKSYEVATEFQLARYDDPTEPVRADQVSFLFDYDLIDGSTGDEVPLENDGVVVSEVNLQSHLRIIQNRIPSFRTLTQRHSFTPLVQLDSRNTTYQLRCTLRHQDRPAPTPLTRHNVVELAARRLLHLSGQLSFAGGSATLSEVRSTPSALAPQANGDVRARVFVAEGGGNLNDRPDVVFGASTLLGTVQPNGTLNLSLGTVPLKAVLGGEVEADYGKFRLALTSPTLSATGLRTDGFVLFLPQGLAFIEDSTAVTRFFRGSSEVVFPSTQVLDNQLAPNAPVILSLPTNAAFAEESHGLLFGSAGQSLTIDGETLDLGGGAVVDPDLLNVVTLQQLAATNQIAPELGKRLSNRSLLSRINPSIEGQTSFRVVDDGTVRTTTDFSLREGSFEPHFPRGAKVSWAQPSAVKLVDGAFSSDSSLIDAEVTQSYYQTCPGDNCTANVAPVEVTLKTGDNKVTLTGPGGLFADGALTTAHQIRWGLRMTGMAADGSPSLDYTHRTSALSNGVFFAPGYQTYAGAQPSDGNESAGHLLLADVKKDDRDDLFYPGQDAHDQGLGYSPGVNFHVKLAGPTGASRLAGASSDYSYALLSEATSRPGGGSKYYLRLSGVSGRHCAVPIASAGGDTLSLFGFEVSLDRYQFSLLSNDNMRAETESWVDGQVRVGVPRSGRTAWSTWSQKFSGLRFDCAGNPTTLAIDQSDTTAKLLQHWNSDFDLLDMEFSPTLTSAPDACPKSYTSHLVVSAKTRASQVPGDLYGQLAFREDGSLSTTASPGGVGRVTSTLGLPATLRFASPSQPYTFTPSTKLRFSNPVHTPSNAEKLGEGFVTFAGLLDVPYFSNLMVQAITSARGSSGSDGRLFLTPGFADAAGRTFFSDDNFDGEHRGYPSDLGLAVFKEPSADGDARFAVASEQLKSEPYLIQAKQSLFGLLPLQYPLRWEAGTGKFTSFAPLKEELLITELEHQVEFLDGQFANVSFGASYDGLPQLKLSNFLNDQIDGASDAVSQALSRGAKKQIDKGLSKLDDLLEDTLEQLIDPVIDRAAGPGGPIDLVLQQIKGANGFQMNARNDYAMFRSKVENFLVAEAPNVAFQTGATSQITAEWTGFINRIKGRTQEADDLLKQVDSALIEVLKGIDVIVSGVQHAANDRDLITFDARDLNLEANFTDSTQNLVKGILYKNGAGEFEIVQSLVDKLLPELLPSEVAGLVEQLLSEATSDLNSQLNELLDDQKPTLDQIRSVLLTVRSVVVQVRMKVGDAGEITKKIQRAADTLTPASILNPIGKKAWHYYLQAEQSSGIQQLPTSDAIQTLEMLATIDRDELAALMKSTLKDAVLESDYVTTTKSLLRQAVYDLHDQLTSALQSALAEVSKTMKGLVKETVGELEEQINPLIGKVNDFLGAGELSGYAEVNGDSLRKLRLDGAFQMKVPDEMNIAAFLEILCYSSEDNFVGNACVQPGEKTVEVRVGATDVAIEWVSDIRINTCVKLSLANDGSPDFPVPIGAAGKLEMAGGELDFQSFILKEFAATVGVGRDECYLGARARATFSNYEVAAGLFFGRTCTIEPLVLVDPDIAQVIDPTSPFTGAYVYGEVWLPISELVLGVPASCMFRIDAGVGAGAFYFIEGPTYGGKILLGVSGEALCLVNVRGEVKMILASQAGNVRGAGTGNFSAKVGACPFCIKFRKKVGINYDNGDWSFN